tara:strand:+ start:317 stop:739 length:423 start_codon:yes stop_codon:yes gene_type:complete
MKWFIKFFKKFLDFNGRSGRREYWMSILFNIIIYLTLLILYIILFSFYFPATLLSGKIVGSIVAYSIVLIYVISILYSLLTFIPLLAISVRRLHDVGYSGFFLLLSLVPLFGIIILLVLFSKDSQPGKNKWGNNPKEKFN